MSLLVGALVIGGGSAVAQSPASVPALLRDLKNRDYETANGALNTLAEVKESRAQVVTGLLDALRTGEWNRCNGDMRDSIARILNDWQTKAAVGPLLQLVKSGKSIEHECSE